MYGSTATYERRHYQRTQLNISANCIRLDPDGGDVVDRIHVIDISRGGLGAIAERPFYPGQRLVLCLPRTQEGGRRNINATVVRCRPRKDGYRIGLEFDATAMGAACAAAAAAAA